MTQKLQTDVEKCAEEKKAFTSEKEQIVAAAEEEKAKALATAKAEAHQALSAAEEKKKQDSVLAPFPVV